MKDVPYAHVTIVQQCLQGTLVVLLVDIPINICRKKNRVFYVFFINHLVQTVSEFV